MRKTIYLALGSLFVALGLVGIFIPILPTTPFLLLSCFFFARSSDRALQWLLNNRWLGAYIRNYREGRGIALRDKIITLTLLWLTILASVVFGIQNNWLRVLVILIAAGVTIHLTRTKTYTPNASTSRSLPDSE